MTAFVVLVASVGAIESAAIQPDANFLDWFRSELAERENSPITFSGKVPHYVDGSFVQTGPARFSFGSTRFTHMMDGYSKTLKIDFSSDGALTFTNRFLESGFLNASTRAGHIARGMFVGPVEPDPHWGPTAVMSSNDNNYIKMRRLGNSTPLLLADTMIATRVHDDLVSFDHDVMPAMVRMWAAGERWKDHLAPVGDMCMLGTMAHAAEDPATGGLIGAMGCTGLSGAYHIVFTITPDAPSTRRLIAKIPLPRGRGPSYMHTLAATPNFVVLLAEPLFMSMERVMEATPLGMGGIYTTNDPTIFQIVDRRDGSVRTVDADAFIYGHIFNAWEDPNGDILIDLTWYAAGNATTLGWFNRWFEWNIHNVSVREAWPRAKAMRFRLGANGTVERTELFQAEAGLNDFETPKINELYSGQRYCIVYAMQFHSYPYDRDQLSMDSGLMGAVGIAKRNLCTGERQGWYRPNEFPSEVQFVPDPRRRSEDDGVLLSVVFDGNSNSSYFQMLDARTMRQIGTAPLPVKSPFLIHASYFPRTG